MSQASKRKAHGLVRGREQVARFLVGHTLPETRRLLGPENIAASLISPPDWVGGEVYLDVHAAREAALTLVALEAEQAVFEDWCEERGKGPENREPGAFMAITKRSVFMWLPDDGTFSYGDGRSDGTPEGGLDVRYHRHQLGRLALDAGPEALADLVSNLRRHGFEPTIPGGWPGKLAREYAWDRCPNKCERFPSGRFYRDPRLPEIEHLIQCTACTDGRVRHGDRDPRAPMGRRLAKLGRAVLRALEGQPSECQRLDCEDGYIDGLAPTDELPGGIPCPDCHGTGHNLRGALPPIECQPQLLRRMHESEGGYHDDTMAPWLVALGQTPMLRPLATPGPIDAAEPAISHVDALELMGPDGVDDRTRVVPRGQHRDTRSYFHPFCRDMWIDLDADLDERITSRGLSTAYPEDLMPRWVRGELRHAEQRDERRRARQILPVFPWSEAWILALPGAVGVDSPAIGSVVIQYDGTQDERTEFAEWVEENRPAGVRYSVVPSPAALRGSQWDSMTADDSIVTVRASD